LKKQSIEIVWFKRDLRVRDHKPLYNASLTGAPVLPLYVLEPGYWSQPTASRRHWCFINDCLNELSVDCSTLGQPLIIKVGDPRKVFEEIRNEFDTNYPLS
jgi:deoxyribodipyrimidine photo-lyase